MKNPKVRHSLQRKKIEEMAAERMLRRREAKKQAQHSTSTDSIPDKVVIKPAPSIPDKVVTKPASPIPNKVVTKPASPIPNKVVTKPATPIPHPKPSSPDSCLHFTLSNDIKAKSLLIIAPSNAIITCPLDFQVPIYLIEEGTMRKQKPWFHQLAAEIGYRFLFNRDFSLGWAINWFKRAHPDDWQEFSLLLPNNRGMVNLPDRDLYELTLPPEIAYQLEPMIWSCTEINSTTSDEINGRYALDYYLARHVFGNPELAKLWTHHKPLGEPDKFKVNTAYLYLCPKTYYNSKLDRNRFHSILALHYTSQIPWIIFGKGWPEYDESLSISDNLQLAYPFVDFIGCIMYKPNDQLAVQDLKLIKSIAYNEMFDETKTSAEIQLARPDLIICHHSNEMTAYQQRFPEIKFAHSPHCADKFTFRDLQLAKKYDFTLVGNSSPKIYPLRYRWKTQIIPLLRRSGYSAHILEHPGYVDNNAEKQDQVGEYVKVINQSMMTLTCSSCFNYLLSKMSEIPACNSVLVTDLPLDDQAQLRDFCVVINPEDSNRTIVDQLIAVRKNQDLLEEKLRKGKEFVAQHRLQEHYAQRYYQIIRPFMKNYLSAREFRVEECVDIRKYEISRHCIWLPDLQIKIPYQEEGVMTKNPASNKHKKSEEMYERNTLAHEYTILKALAEKKMAPPIGRIVKFQKYYDAQGVMIESPLYGYEMADAAKVNPGCYDGAIWQQLPVRYSPGALGDCLKPGNTLNGYLIDIRRSGNDMMRWLDSKTFYWIEEVSI